MNTITRLLMNCLPMKKLILPKMNVDDQEKLKEFINLVKSGETDFGNFQPLYKWIQYAISSEEYLVHGSPIPGIEIFTPRKQKLFNGKETTAVFASSNAVWSLFFAILDPSTRVGSLRNGCFMDNGKSDIRSYYLFSLDSSWKDPFCSGYIYIFPKKGFKQGGSKAEWICEREIQPIASISVEPTDFPFLHSVGVHGENEPLWKTWLKRK